MKNQKGTGKEILQRHHNKVRKGIITNIMVEEEHSPEKTFICFNAANENFDKYLL